MTSRRAGGAPSARSTCALAGALALSLLAPPALGAEGDERAPRPIPPETVGTWRFKDPERLVKAVIVGGSVTAWSRGNFGQFLQAACPRVEIVNRGKARLGARKLRERFDKQVLRNRRLDRAALDELWLIFHGGLNSIGDPEGTNRFVADTLRHAHEHGIGTIALSLGPWGADYDRRWKGAGGLEYQARTRRAVDFVMGRLAPRDAFGSRARGDSYEPGELPDIAVDLYDSSLRDREATLRDQAATERAVTRSGWVRERLRLVAEADRDQARSVWIQRAREIPRWYLRPALRAFDHIHPNLEGHRAIAVTTCPTLPSSWGCDCAAISAMRWDRQARRLTVAAGAAGRASTAEAGAAGISQAPPAPATDR